MGIRLSTGQTSGAATNGIPSTNRSTGSGRTTGLVTGLIFIVGGIAFFWSSIIRPAVRATEAATTWHRVPCTIVYSRVAEKPAQGNDDAEYSVNVRYRYVSDGRAYESSQFNFLNVPTGGRDDKQATVNRYPLGSTATCYVNPADPADAVLEPNMGGRAWLLALPATFVLVFGMLCMVLSLRSGRRAAAGPVPATPVVTAGGGGDAVTLKLAARPLPQFLTSFVFSIVFDGILIVFLWMLLMGRLHSIVFPLIWMLFWSIGCVLLTASAVRGFLSLFNPRATVTLSRGAVPLGASAELQWNFEGRYDRINKLSLRLEGRERATYAHGTHTSTDNRVFVTVPLFETDRADLIERGKCTLRLPAEAMHTFRSKNNQILWFVVLSGEIPRWPDVKQEFEIEVPPPQVTLMGEAGAALQASIVSPRPDGPLRVRTVENRTSFSPGETIAGTVSWSLPAAPRKLEVRLFWFTRGKGTVDLGVVDAVAIDDEAMQGEHGFTFRVPNGPYSASGSLVSIVWGIELVAEPKGGADRMEIVCAPGGQERVLDAASLPLAGLLSPTLASR